MIYFHADYTGKHCVHSQSMLTDREIRLVMMLAVCFFIYSGIKAHNPVSSKDPSWSLRFSVAVHITWFCTPKNKICFFALFEWWSICPQGKAIQIFERKQYVSLQLLCVWKSKGPAGNSWALERIAQDIFSSRETREVCQKKSEKLMQ